MKPKDKNVYVFDKSLEHLVHVPAIPLMICTNRVTATSITHEATTRSAALAGPMLDYEEKRKDRIAGYKVDVYRICAHMNASLQCKKKASKHMSLKLLTDPTIDIVPAAQYNAAEYIAPLSFFCTPSVSCHVGEAEK